MIKVLIVDDSASVRELFTEMFKREVDFEVVGCAENGASALQMVADLVPDVATMDVNLPDYDGFTVTRRIMEECPIPIVIISAVYSASDAELGFRLLDTGALAFHDKPAFNSPDFPDRMAEIVMSVRLMSEVKVVRRRSRFKRESGLAQPVSRVLKIASEKKLSKVVCIGASTGGPHAIKKVLMSLPVNFAAPVIIVQHMSGGFTEGMVNWLKGCSGHNIKIAEQGEKLRPGIIYFGPEDYHLEISKDKEVILLDCPAVNGIRPTVSRLFGSAARNLGKAAVGVLLTGMGRDGADELLEIRMKGGHTIAQNRETSIVFGMPGEAVKIGAAVSVLPLDKIGAEINSHVSGSLGG
ncbi:chemotaxis-specific protein-glutamate methyltransferase CheB [Maridesulfovibrio hydrothermalis]|uniref:Protein-glutamate methylesterase/protein-glutamine glutaminase n=1 Tax=Maridesulfovibrio hydrothermalis AM13 = DSM 14728 TaxID=1121451 RepID=L0RHT8_9BACT|nr:chemotaxis-specific protein-glutamate methyltransferase CheB [Maridesulfovibrio hydrothermalis]CCO25156.1 Chemotaxis response regulator protein-glutamate methylesterase 1 [Maridesulfovibrio hydrothermalis AM13 = DSM 14728]